MIKVYHNNRCSKSRSACTFLAEKGLEVEIVEYLKTPLSREVLKDILSKLNMKPLDLVRKGEKVFKELFKGQNLTDDQWIEAMLEHPILIERPIVVKGNKAVVARPMEKIEDLF